MTLGKIMEIILNILIFIVVTILIFAGTYLFQTQIEHKDYANIFGYTFFQISTGSMSPTIEVEDIVFVRITTEIKENDIIVFKEDNNLITHRVVKIDGNKIVTKGDANNSNDKEISKEQVVGKVIKIFGQIAIWEKVFFTPQVFISVTATIVLFGFAFSYNGKSNNENKKLEKEEENLKNKDVR